MPQAADRFANNTLTYWRLRRRGFLAAGIPPLRRAFFADWPLWSTGSVITGEQRNISFRSSLAVRRSTTDPAGNFSLSFLLHSVGHSGK